jgi:DNA-directed RNA polymerase alpha subunit
MSKEDLLGIRNFGQKSLDELYGTLREQGILESSEEPEPGEEPESGDAQEESEELAAVQAASGDSGDET